MFAIKECNKKASFCYVSMISKILKHFKIGEPNLEYLSPRAGQEFD